MRHVTEPRAARVRPRTLCTGLVILLALLALAIPGLASAAPVPAWRLIGATGPTNLPPFASEIQRLLVNAESGIFSLAFEGEQTDPLPFNATPAELRAALELLPAIGPGNVEVSGGPGDASANFPYFIRFAGSLAGVNAPQLTADSALLSGAGHIATVSTTTQGGAPGVATLALYATNVGGIPTSGPIKASVGPLPAGITATAFGVLGTRQSPANGVGWICIPAGSGRTTLACESTTAVASGGTAEPLLVPLEIAAGAPSTATVSLSIEGGGALAPSSYSEPLTVSSVPAKAGLQAFWAGAFDEDGQPSTEAGGHPFQAGTGFLVNTNAAPNGDIVPAGDLRTVNVALPPGFIGNPLVTSRCPQAGPLTIAGGGSVCTSNSQVGLGGPVVQSFGSNANEVNNGVYNDVPPFGYPAEFSFPFVFATLSTFASLRSDGDYGITIEAPNIPLTQPAYGSFVTLFGAPAAAAGKAFLTNPADCAEQARRTPVTTVSNNSWQDQDLTAVDNELTVAIPPITNCGALGPLFQPSFSFRPQDSQAASPTAYAATLRMPQGGLLDPAALAAPPLKKAVVTLPKGVKVNPSSANGLEACSEAEIGLLTTSGELPNPIRFDKSAPRCPEASKLGTVEAKSPLLEETLGGTIYLAAQEENPFHSLLALYLVIDSPRNGILVKLPGEVTPDPSTGQLTATFDNNPQLPVEDLKLNFRGGGPQSPLGTPSVCTTYTTRGSFTPWSAPESGPPAETQDSFDISGRPGGGPCASSEAGLPFSPGFEAGTTSTAAGAYAPLVIKLARKDGEQELTHLDFTLPPGLTGKLAGVSYCSEAAIAAAKGKTGKNEQASPSCPTTSELGTVDTAAGVGSEPIHVGGHVYLAGPYEGAPLSSVVITPAVAGPFDLGTVVVRAPLYVNPETAQITAKSDEIPHILKGIPLQLRSVEIKVTRQGFALNPTSCNPMSVSSSLSGLNGATASPSSRFQVGGCKALPFKPGLKLSVLGKTNRNSKPRLKAVLTAKPGEANIARAQVNLPHSEFLEQNHIKTVCTRVQFAQGDGNGSACPKGSIYGRAKAWTPLLDHPLEGLVFLRSSSHKLPDLVAALDGQIDIALAGKVDSGPNKGIRNTFEVVPDAPVSRFVLEMAGGKKGLLVNSENLCSPKAKRTAIIRFVGQNGKVRHFKQNVANQCKKRHAKKHKGPNRGPNR